MRVTEISIKRFLGIEEKRLECGQITTVAGANGSGKSSVLQAVQAAIGGGDLARLKKVGATDEPEIVLILDDGRYRVERKGDETVVKERVGTSAAYEKIRRPQSWLDSLFDPVLSNPLRFLNAHPNERADLMLEVLPLQLDRDAFMAKIAAAWPAGKELAEGHPLEVLAFARTTLFDERTGVNRSQKDKAASAYELQKALPAEMPKDPAAEQKTAAQERDVLFQKLAARRSEAEVSHQRAVDAATAAYEQTAEKISGAFRTTAAKIRGELERKIAALKEETEKQIAAEKAVAEEAIAKADEMVAQAQGAADETRREALALVDALQPDLQKLNERAAALAAQAQDSARLQKQKEMADRFEAEAESLKAVSERLTKAIDTVDATKLALVKDLPIAGLEIAGRQILVNGIPFDQLNTGARIAISVKVATLRARKQVLPVIFVDGAEALDQEHYDLLVRELEASGCQAFIAKVDDKELRIEARDGGEHPSEAKVVPMREAAGNRPRTRRVLAE